MKIKETQKTKGFTIIEVVLVLAIAGLIFMMVFLALPALQKSQRDTQRKSDLARIMNQLTSYTSNNRGIIPTDLTASFVKNYLGGGNPVVTPASGTDGEPDYVPATTTGTAGPDYLDPLGTTNYKFLTAGVQPSHIGEVGYKASSKCGEDGAFDTSTARQFAIEITLESQTAPYCLDNR